MVHFSSTSRRRVLIGGAGLAACGAIDFSGSMSGAVVPNANSAALQAKLIRDVRFEVYRGPPHSLTATHRDRYTRDLLAFTNS